MRSQLENEAVLKLSGVWGLGVLPRLAQLRGHCAARARIFALIGEKTPTKPNQPSKTEEN